MLAFGWLFMAPANGDDPLTIAAQEIQELNSAVDKLEYKDELNNLIDIAENKFISAKNMKDARDAAAQAYEDALDAEANALAAKISAQEAVDAQQLVVNQALENKNDAQDALDLANINLQTAQSNMQSVGGSGLQYTVYNLTRTWPSIATPSGVICSGSWNSNSMNLPVCGNRYENIIVKFTGQITVPSWFTTVAFAGYTDDGFRMFIDGNLAVNNWVEQGARWSAWSPTYDVSEDKTLDVEIWWYNGGGPGSYHLGWTIPGGMTGAGCDYAGDPRVWGQNFSCNLNTFSSGSGPTQQQIDAYNQALADKNAAQQNYNDKLTIYNAEVSTLNSLNQNLINKTSEYDNAVVNTANNLDAKNNTINGYNNQINDLNNAIQDAWNYYDEQSQKEIQRAIAQAAANAAANQPKPEPSPEPKPTEEAPKPKPSAPPTPPSDDPNQNTKPEPKPTNPTATGDPDGAIGNPEPKPTPPIEPKPEPKPEPAPEPKPEPKPEPAPEPSVEPAPEPKPEPKPDFKPAENIDPVIKDEVLAALIPEKGTGTSEDLSGVIANLTSKDNKLIKLSPEQTAAVSQTLKALTQEAKKEVAKELGISAVEVAKVAEEMKSNPALASAFVEFNDRVKESASSSATPYTLADVVTEVQMEQFLADPMAAIGNINPTELLSNFSELGSDMTDDQREKAQEVIVPVIIASQIAGAVMRRLN